MDTRGNPNSSQTLTGAYQNYAPQTLPVETICGRIARLEARLQSLEEQTTAALQTLEKRVTEVELRLG